MPKSQCHSRLVGMDDDEAMPGGLKATTTPWGALLLLQLQFCDGIKKDVRMRIKCDMIVTCNIHVTYMYHSDLSVPISKSDHISTCRTLVPVSYQALQCPTSKTICLTSDLGPCVSALLSCPSSAD